MTAGETLPHVVLFGCYHLGVGSCCPECGYRVLGLRIFVELRTQGWGVGPTLQGLHCGPCRRRATWQLLVVVTLMAKNTSRTHEDMILDVA